MVITKGKFKDTLKREIVYAPRIPPTHLNTASFENLQTLGQFSESVLWLVKFTYFLKNEAE